MTSTTLVKEDYVIKSIGGRDVSSYSLKQSALEAQQRLAKSGTTVNVIKRTTTIEEEILND